jgi:hypothetical protein
MNALLPQGREHEFDMADVAAAYQYFWVHEAGADYATYRALIGSDLYQLGLSVFGFHSDDSAQTAKRALTEVSARYEGWMRQRGEAELRAEIDLFRNRLKLGDLAKAKIGNRVPE